MIVKPMPLRSSPPVVNMGWRAFSTSAIPRPASLTVISSTLPAQMRALSFTVPMESGYAWTMALVTASLTAVLISSSSLRVGSIWDAKHATAVRANPSLLLRLGNSSRM